jgi:shikimate dehydrogenase
VFRYGLIGKSLSHSFSPRYFTEKFEREGLKDHRYDRFELQRIEQFPDLLARHRDLAGLNVTIPYKTAIIPTSTAWIRSPPPWAR